MYKTLLIVGGLALAPSAESHVSIKLEGLKALKREVKVDVYTDSTYVRDGITQWIHDWKIRGWRGSNKKPVKNVDLWQELDEVASQYEVQWHWVKGHAGHPENERADLLATEAAENQS